MSHSTESLALSIARGSAGVALAAYGICLVQEGADRFQEAANARIEAWTGPVAAVETTEIAEAALSQIDIVTADPIVAEPSAESMPLDIGAIGLGSLALSAASGVSFMGLRRHRQEA